MREEFKKYYETSYGVFARLTTEEIKKLCKTKEDIMGLQGVIFLKEGWTATEPDDMIPQYFLRAKMEYLLSIAKN